MKYFVKFRKGNSNWDTTDFDCFADAQEFQLRLQDAGYEADLTWTEPWDKTDMTLGDPDHHHEFAYA